MSWLPYLIEFRKRLLNCLIAITIAFIILFYFSDRLFSLLAIPLLHHLTFGQKLIATAVTAPIFTPLKLSSVLSLIIVMPYILWQIWMFIAPGLYKYERRVLWLFLSISVVLFYLGMLFAYSIVFPLIFSVFVKAVPSVVTMMPDMTQYLDFCLKLFLAFGITFEVPVITLLLIYTGITTVEQLKQYRPYVIVSTFILAMLLTPPDVISQIVLAVPMWFLFEFGLLMAKYLKLPAKIAENDNKRSA